MVSEMERLPLTFGAWVAGVIARWRTILKVVGVVLLLAAVAAVALPPVYKGHASFVTSSSANKAPSAAASTPGLQGIASQFGVGSLGGEPSESPSFYLQLIESEEVRRRLLNSRFQDPHSKSPRDSATLLSILRINNDDSVRRMEIGLKKMSKAIAANADVKTNLVTVTASAQWPQLAAAMTNRVVQLVDAFNHEQRVSRARSKRVFLQTRLDSAKLQLNQAEEMQRVFYEVNRSWKNSPGLEFEEGRLRRNADVATDLFQNLQRQFEAARLDEFNDAAMITVVDSATTPHKAQWPRYWILLAASLVIGTILGVLIAGAQTILDDWRARNPDVAQALSDSIRALPIPMRQSKPARRGKPETFVS